MDTDAHGLQESGLTEAVIGAAFEISKVLGAGFLEKVYERALLRELMLRGVSARAQVSFPVRYKDHYVGEYVADLVVEEKLLVELKCVDRFANDHLAQCIIYRKASGLRAALLINFQRPGLNGSVSFSTSGIVQSFPGHYTGVCSNTAV
jgi:GxxExxY protein